MPSLSAVDYIGEHPEIFLDIKKTPHAQLIAELMETAANEIAMKYSQRDISADAVPSADVLMIAGGDNRDTSLFIVRDHGYGVFNTARLRRAFTEKSSAGIGPAVITTFAKNIRIMSFTNPHEPNGNYADVLFHDRICTSVATRHEYRGFGFSGGIKTGTIIAVELPNVLFGHSIDFQSEIMADQIKSVYLENARKYATPHYKDVTIRCLSVKYDWSNEVLWGHDGVCPLVAIDTLFRSAEYVLTFRPY